MFLKTIPADTLGSRMLERADTLFQMKEKKLDAGWVTDFPLPQLTECCNRMEQYLSGITVEKTNLQQKLIQNLAYSKSRTGLSENFLQLRGIYQSGLQLGFRSPFFLTVKFMKNFSISMNLLKKI